MQNEVCAEGRWYLAFTFSDSRITAVTDSGEEVTCIASDNTIKSEYREEFIPDQDHELHIREAASNGNILIFLLNRPQKIAIQCYACTLARINDEKIYCIPNDSYLKPSI